MDRARRGDGIRIEITGCAHLWGGETALAADLARRLARRGIAGRIAIAGTLGAAWALARFAAEPGRPALPAPARSARRAGAAAGRGAAARPGDRRRGCAGSGLRRVGDLYPMPRDALARRFGESVARRLDQALGRAAGAAVAARRGAGAAGAAQLCRADRRPGRSSSARSSG